MPAIGGSQTVVTDLGLWQTRQCEHCGETGRFSVYLQYRWSYLYGVFGQVSWRTYSLVCDRCQQGFVLDPIEMRRMLRRDPIPWHRRHGWTVPAFGLVALLLLTLLATFD